MSKHHDRIRNDPRWKAARTACLERDGYMCVVCNSDQDLQVDHILELSLHPELAFDVDNLQTLCAGCHDDKGKGGSAATEVERLAYVNPKYADALAGVL